MCVRNVHVIKYIISMGNLIKNHFRKALRQLFVWPRFKSSLFRETKAYRRDLEHFEAQGDKHGMEIPFGIPFPCLLERNDNGGTANGHYFHQDLLVARRIFTADPMRHIDVGSRIDGFVANVASFREIEIIDIRPLDSAIPNVSFLQADLMSEIDFSYEECCDSVSCLHALEHFGLGRYGDPVEYEGHIL